MCLIPATADRNPEGSCAPQDYGSCDVILWPDVQWFPGVTYSGALVWRSSLVWYTVDPWRDVQWIPGMTYSGSLVWRTVVYWCDIQWFPHVTYSGSLVWRTVVPWCDVLWLPGVTYSDSLAWRTVVSALCSRRYGVRAAGWLLPLNGGPVRPQQGAGAQSGGQGPRAGGELLPPQRQQAEIPQRSSKG